MTRSTGAVSRADLVALLTDLDAAADDRRLVSAGRLVNMHFERRRDAPEPVVPTTRPAKSEAPDPRPEISSTARHAPVPFIVATELEYFGRDDGAAPDRKGPGTLSLDTHDPEDPAYAPDDSSWFPWKLVEHPLLAVLGARNERRAVDRPRLIRAMARLRPLTKIPRRRRTAWPSDLLIVVEDEQKYRPFRKEMLELAVRLTQTVGHARTTLTRASSGYADWVEPRAGRTGLVLPAVDGRLARQRADYQERWWGLELRSGRPVLLEGAAEESAGKARQARAEALLTALVPAARVETELLRQLAFEFAYAGFDAFSVLDAWNHPWMIRGDTNAIAWTKEGRRVAFERWKDAHRAGGVMPDMHRRALVLTRALHRAWYAPSLWYEETLSLRYLCEKSDDAWAWLAAQNELEEVDGFFSDLAAQFDVDERARTMGGQWVRDLAVRRPELVSDAVGSPTRGFQPVVHCLRRLEGKTGAVKARRWRLSHDGAVISAVDGATSASPGFVADVWASSPALAVQADRHPHGPLARAPSVEAHALLTHRTSVDLVSLAAEARRVAWAQLRRSESWASDFGWDRFGLWADVELNGVSFRMRWIEPGSFMMGSPPDEEGRRPR